MEEEHAQREYDALTAECATSWADKIKEVKELQNTRASVIASPTQSKVKPASAVSSATEIANVIGSLHQRYNWLLQNFDVCKMARAGEVKALNNV